MAQVYLALVLHAHLPFVRHPEAPSYMEEEWFFEAISETYIPLLLAFERLIRDGIDFRLTLSVSPTLLSMLSDDLLKERYASKLDKLVELAEREVERTHADGRFHGLAQMYRDRFVRIREYWQRQDGDLVWALREMQDAGQLEVITCTATHPFIPLLDRNWAALRAQVHVAAEVVRAALRTSDPWASGSVSVGTSRGWTSSCAKRGFATSSWTLMACSLPIVGRSMVYTPRSTAPLAWRHSAGMCRVRGRFGVRRKGIQATRTTETSIGISGVDLPLDYIRPYIHPDGIRTYTGIKYHAITHNSLQNKRPYVPHVAWQRANEHAKHFLHEREEQVRNLRSRMDRQPIIVAPYDRGAIRTLVGTRVPSSWRCCCARCTLTRV